MKAFALFAAIWCVLIGSPGVAAFILVLVALGVFDK